MEIKNMRLKSFVNELTSLYGPGITFMDIDETILHTNARTVIWKDGKIVKKLRNREFLAYTPAEGETADFSEYTDAKNFHATSTPVETVVNRMKRMFQHIGGRGSRVVIVSARADSNDKQEFLQTFRDLGIQIDDIYVERVGKAGSSGTSIPEKKKAVMFKYLSSGLYRRARLIDDSLDNCKAFLELEDEIPQEVIDKVKEKYNIKDTEPIPPIQFFALQVMKDGSLKRILR
jgi:hypothetical protein